MNDGADEINGDENDRDDDAGVEKDEEPSVKTQEVKQTKKKKKKKKSQQKKSENDQPNVSVFQLTLVNIWLPVYQLNIITSFSYLSYI